MNELINILTLAVWVLVPCVIYYYRRHAVKEKPIWTHAGGIYSSANPNQAAVMNPPSVRAELMPLAEPTEPAAWSWAEPASRLDDKAAGAKEPGTAEVAGLRQMLRKVWCRRFHRRHHHRHGLDGAQLKVDCACCGQKFIRTRQWRQSGYIS